MLRAEDVARYFLANQHTEDAGQRISHLKLQKLCYYAQGFALAVLNRPLFLDDIEHWQHGPVVPSLWREYRSYGSEELPIPRDLNLKLYDAETQSLLDGMYHMYGQFSAWELRNMTHTEPPWANSPGDAPITHLALRAYFKTLVTTQDQTGLGANMALDRPFRELTKCGFADIQAGRFSKLEDLKSRLGDV